MHAVIEVDGSAYSGSGTIVRQAVMYSALTGRPVHIVNARARRPQAGLRPQHVRVVQALQELTGGTTEGVAVGSRELTFVPGPGAQARGYVWDIGSAGSTTMLALAVLPVLALRAIPTSVELRGGVFQDFAPSVFHLQHVILPLLRRMGLRAELRMERPGYVPAGGGILRLEVAPIPDGLHALQCEVPGKVDRLWGVALASHLAQRRVGERMAEAASTVLAGVGRHADVEVVNDESALQSGAALALFADLAGGSRLGADRAGAPHRSSEAIGRHVARQLLEEIASGSTLDRFAADQIVAFAALAYGESHVRVPCVTDHVQTNAWLAAKFLEAHIIANGCRLAITGVGFRPVWR